MTQYSEKNLHERIILRHSYIKTLREPWEPDCNLITEMFSPERVKFSNAENRSTISILGAKIYEGTGPWALRLMADGIQGQLASRSLEWFRHDVDDVFLKGNDDINQWLQNFDEHSYSVYRKSTFYDSLSPFCRAGLGVGSPVMIPELDQRSGRIKCLVPHLAERYIMQNAFGETDVLHLEKEWTIRNAVREFGKFKTEDGKRVLTNFSQSVRHQYESGNENAKVIIIKTFYFYLDRIFEGLPAKDKPRWPWMSYHVEKNREGEEGIEKRPLKVEGYWSKPFIIWHYEKDPAEVYARTPAWFSYWDVNSMSANRKSLIMAGQKAVEQSWWAPSFLKGKFKTYPKGINWFEPGQAALKPEPLMQKIDYPRGTDIEERLARGVERWFHVRMWMMLSIWAEEQKAPPTATQIIQMAGERAILLGPRVGRFMGVLEQIDDRFINIEQRRGALPEPPDVFLEYSNGEILPEFIGPLAQLQKQFLSVRKIENALASCSYIFENVDPLTKHKLVAERTVERILEENKLPQDEIRSDDEYQEIVSAVAQQQKFERNLQIAAQVADVVPKLTGEVADNSPAKALMEAAA